MELLLEDRTAVVYGGSGRIGGAVARAFAREGARVFLAGRTQATLDAVAADITAAGGVAESALVDALDEGAVDAHADAVVAKAGAIDVSFNAIGHDDVHGAPLLDMPFEDFVRPVHAAVRTQFLTGRAAARHMVPRGSGVIMAITATTARMSIPNVGGTGVAFDAIESLCRQQACELGPKGVRVVWLLTTGIPEAMSDSGELFPDYGAGPLPREAVIEWLQSKTLLNRLTTLADVGNAAAYLASDRGAAVTAGPVNLSVGAIPGR
jgi:NAD(P)-dependent dehydrogenase (short-subunit alcohol dehydrogenase family)